MSEAEESLRTELLGRLRFSLEVPVDFTSAEPEVIPAKVRLLTAAATYFNVLTVSEFGGRVGPVREHGLVEQVVAAAFQTFEGVDPHPEPFDKAAMLLRGITQGHPFTDGNKRTGFLVATYYLARVGYLLNPEVDAADVVSFCRRVSAGQIRDVEVMARTLAAWSLPRDDPNG